MSQIAAVSVDLDSIGCYEQIHGLGPATTTDCAVYTTALERLSRWSRMLRVPITWFVVGQSLEASTVCERLGALHAEGDELANHTESHLYDLTCRSREVMRRELEQTRDRLRSITGELRFGFRAPGYRMTDELMDVLRETEALYDSSVFPCPTYWVAKASVLAGQRALGRRSHSILDHPRVVFGPRLPYRVGESYLRSGRGLVEMPISVTPNLRLPFIGTSLVLAGKAGAQGLVRLVSRVPFVNLEMHGIDALDEGDGLSRLRSVQPDLRVPWQRKLEILGGAIQTLRDHEFEFVTLKEAALRCGT